MYDKLRNYIESLFEDAPATSQAVEIKEEIIQNTTQRYNDLLAEGKSEDAAFNIAIAGIGDVSDLLSSLRGQAQNYSYMGFTREEIEKDNKRSAILTSTAIMLYILCIIPPILMSSTPFSGDLAVCLMFIMVAVATALLIYNSKTRLQYKKKDDNMVENFKEWNSDNKERNSTIKSICSAVWALTLAIYFIVSFMTHAWYITWVIFIIGCAVQNIIKACFESKR